MSLISTFFSPCFDELNVLKVTVSSSSLFTDKYEIGTSKYAVAEDFLLPATQQKR